MIMYHSAVHWKVYHPLFQSINFEVTKNYKLNNSKENCTIACEMKEKED